MRSLARPGGQPAPGGCLRSQAATRRTSVTGRDPPRVTVKEGNTEQHVATVTPLLEQARKEPGTLLYALHRSKDDPHMFWTTEIYHDDAASAAHGASEAHAAPHPCSPS